MERPKLLATIIVTPNKPSIRFIRLSDFTSVNNGEDLYIEWYGKNLDNDTLTYTLYYSDNYGVSWHLIDHLVRRNNYTWKVPFKIG